MGPKPQVPIDRFWKYVMTLPWSGCWIWMGFTDKDGYGHFSKSGSRSMRAHRFSYEYHKGTIPADREIDHRCRVTSCVNPEHLDAVEHSENIRRALDRHHHKIKTHCPSGHSYDEANTYIHRNGSRKCRKCHTERENRRYRERAKT
jgi:HNH endonuclease